MYLNEATLLNNVRVRYSKDKIYVSTTEYMSIHVLPLIRARVTGAAVLRRLPVVPPAGTGPEGKSVFMDLRNMVFHKKRNAALTFF